MRKIEKIEKLKSGEIYPSENLEQYLKRIKDIDPELNAFIDVYEDQAFEQAEKLDKKIENNEPKGRLFGLVMAVKSNIATQGFRITCASKTLENYISPYDATAIEKLKAEDVIIVGTTNMDEFACGSSGETSYFGPTDNYRARGHIPGGSSSGSASAVAAEMVDFALGTDTGGSIRNPSSHCGVYGFKPSYGLVSRYGLIDLAMSLDQIGPLSLDPELDALILDIIKGKDDKDMRTVDYEGSLMDKVRSVESKSLTIRYPSCIFDFIHDQEIAKIYESFINKLKSHGYDIEEIEMDSKVFELAIPIYYLNVYIEFFSGTRKFDGLRYGLNIDEVAGPEVKRRIKIGSIICAKEYKDKYYVKARKAMMWLRSKFNETLANIDILLIPTVPKAPHKLGEEITDPLVMYAYDVFTVPISIAGACCGVVNMGFINGHIPIGAQLVGKRLDDHKVLRLMMDIDQELDPLGLR